MNRKKFLQSILGVSSSLAFTGIKAGSDDIHFLLESIQGKTSGSMVGFKADPIPKVKIAMIGLGNRGKTLLKMLEWMIKHDIAEVVGFSDILEPNILKAQEILSDWQQRKPKTYSKNEDDWKNLVDQDDVDLVLITTPWEWHTPMAIYAMNKGKHVACEVPIAYSLLDCWSLVETAERQRRHCIMLENCCYNDEELLLLNMIEEGVFGDITHCEGAYLHDLRAHMLSDTYYQGQWRIKHHMQRDGNLYTTHGLGPISSYLHIGRGDTYDHLTSMSSRELNLSETAKDMSSPYTQIKCGDMNNTLIKTSKGKTVLLQFDVHTGRPYSRINKVVGTKAVHDGYPSRLYVDDGELLFWGHEWLAEDEYKSMTEKYRHPMITKLSNLSKEFKEGHGGMDFVMMYRLIRCLNLGLPLDLNVYDGVMWSAVTPLSELSVASRSMSIPFPDFTGNTWKKDKALEINREIS